MEVQSMGPDWNLLKAKPPSAGNVVLDSQHQPFPLQNRYLSVTTPANTDATLLNTCFLLQKGSIIKHHVTKNCFLNYIYQQKLSPVLVLEFRLQSKRCNALH